MHLIVVQHGLWGAPANTAYLCDLLREKLGAGHHILNGDVNSGNLTYDGIDVCGDRLHALVLATLQLLADKGTPVTGISLIGYSMGGLIVRYLAGKLYAEGRLDSIAPLNFITVATPHLGSWRMPSSWYNRAFNYMLPVVTSRTGYQLVLQDKHAWGKPLLCLMSHPDLPFMRALRSFRRLALYANVFHDRPVPYCTAAIRLDNPYEQRPPVPIDPKYPSIVTPSAARAAAKGGVGGAAAATVTAAAAVACDAEEGAASPLYGGPGAAAAGGGGSNAPEPEQHAPLAEQPLRQQRPLRSTYLRVLFVVFFPLAVPALLLMVFTGRSHHCKMQRTPIDFSWLTQHGSRRRSGDGEAAARLEGDAAPDVSRSGGDGTYGNGSTGQEGELPSDIECPSAPSLPAPSSASGGGAAADGRASGGSAAAAAAGAVTKAAAAAALAGAASGSLDADGADGVVVSEQSVLLHDGIVELPEELHRVQEWIVEQLNQLPWHKVDVDCRDFHAHAAIIMRNPRRFTHSRDVLDHLAAHFVRDPT